MAAETEFEKKELQLLKEEGADKPKVVFNVSVDAFGQGLEPHYYWVLDFLKTNGFEVEKFSDFFDSAAGSSFFSELGTKRSVMQERGMKMLETVNGVIRSIINLVFDLRDLEYRLNLFKEARGEPSKGIKPKEESELSLKSIWLTEVDVNTGPAAIVNQARNRNATGLIDFFIWTKDIKDVDKLPAINERIKRILKGKFNEYLKWKEVAFRELTQKFNVEKLYLKSQVNSLKLYARWAKPYLIAAQQLEEKRTLDPNIVSTFDTIRLDISIIGKKKIDRYQFPNFEYTKTIKPTERLSKIKAALENRVKVLEAKKGAEDAGVKAIKERAEAVDGAIKKTVQNACVKVKFVFRSAPQLLRTEAGAGAAIRHTGRVDIEIKAFVLSDLGLERLQKLYSEEAFEFIDNITSGSLGAIAEDLDKYVDEKGVEKKGEEKKGKKSSDIFGPAFKDMGKLLSEIFGGFFGLAGVGIGARNYFKTIPKEDILKLRGISERLAVKGAKELYKMYKISRNMYTMFGEEV